jgi:uncharacterized membrane protein YoaK (UPF0700 family)
MLVAASTVAKQKPVPMTVYYLAAIANGIQNSVSSTYTANLCRTTHMSSMSSDIGTFLGQVLRGNRENVYRLRVFLTLVASFWSGGFVAFRTTQMFASSSLLFSAWLFILVGLNLVDNSRRGRFLSGGGSNRRVRSSKLVDMMADGMYD